MARNWDRDYMSTAMQKNGFVVTKMPSIPDWMKGKALKRLFSVLDKAKVDARFVGACVRNTLLGREVETIDIAVTLPPDQMMRVLQSAGVKALATNIQFGTITAVMEGGSFEISTLRRDFSGETQGTVIYTQDWLEDAQRRDFTLNALYADRDGNIYDAHKARGDLEKGIVRFIGDPMERLKQDPIRIFKYLKTHAHFGRGKPEKGAVESCITARPLVIGLGRERVREELMETLRAPDPMAAMTLMLEHHLLQPILPQAVNLRLLQKMVQLEQSQEQADPVRRLAALLLSKGVKAGEIAPLLRLSHLDMSRIERMWRMRLPSLAGVTESAALRVLHEIGSETFVDALYMNAALQGEEVQKHLGRLLQLTEGWEPAVFPLTGEDLIGLGLTPGPQVGILLKEAKRWWAKNDFKPDYEDCLERLKIMIQEQTRR